MVASSRFTDQLPPYITHTHISEMFPTTYGLQKPDVNLYSISLRWLETLRIQDKYALSHGNQKADKAQQKRETKILLPAVLH